MGGAKAVLSTAMPMHARRVILDGMGEVAEQILRLGARERLALIGVIWDSLVDEGVDIPLSHEQRLELRRRVAEHRRDPDAAIPWSEVKRRLARR